MVVRTTSSIGATLRAFFGVAFVIVGALATAATVAGFFGSVWWGFDLAADFRMQYLAILALVAVLYGLTFGRGAAAIFALAAIANGIVVAPLWLESQPSPRSEASLTVATYNAQRRASEQDRIVAWLRNEPAEIVFVEETTADWADGFAAADLPYRVLLAPPPRTVFGTTVLTTVEATAGTMELAGRPVTVVDATLGGRPVTIFETHPRRPTSDTEAEARSASFAALARLLADRSDPAIVVGDLGTTRWSHAFGTLTGPARLRPADDGAGFRPTWGLRPWPFIGAWTGIPVDHVLIGPGLTTVAYRIGPDLGSSHRPAVARLGLAG